MVDPLDSKVFIHLHAFCFPSYKLLCCMGSIGLMLKGVSPWDQTRHQLFLNGLQPGFLSKFDTYYWHLRMVVEAPESFVKCHGAACRLDIGSGTINVLQER